MSSSEPPTGRGTISLEGWEEVVSGRAQPSPAQPGSEVTAPSVFPGTFRGRAMGHQSFLCIRGLPTHRGSL